MSHMIKVQLADKSGHAQEMMSPAETVETIQQNSSSWIYADNQLVQADQVDEANLSTVSIVRILPALVGGSTYSPQEGEEELQDVGANG